MSWRVTYCLLWALCTGAPAKVQVHMMDDAYDFMRGFSAQHPEGSAYDEWALCGVRGGAPPAPNATDLVVLAALWTPGMPFLQVLAWQGPYPMRRSPYTQVPGGPGACAWPSGARTEAHLYWPRTPFLTSEAQRQRRRWPAEGRPSFRYLCAVPPADQAAMREAEAVTVDLASGPHRRALALCRRRARVAGVTLCPNALYKVRPMHVLYPDILAEWVAHHRAQGVDRVLVYEMFGAKLGPLLRPLVAAGLAEYLPAFARGLLQVPALEGFCWELDDLKHDHCLFTSALRSKWVMLTNAPDAFLWVAPPGGLRAALAPYAAHPAVLVLQHQCGSRKVANGTSLLLSFTGDCEARARVRYVVANPRAVYNSYIHFPLAVQPPHRPWPVLDERRVSTRHFMNCYRPRHTFRPPLVSTDWNVVAHRALARDLGALNWSAGALPEEDELTCREAPPEEPKKGRGAWNPFGIWKALTARASPRHE